ncbi:MAG: hydrogenase maturation nickel metallochaperone HypA [Acidobacteriota bacterium]|nr:hydrogenase maturation nickel metallochaperone HypA [Acidobacteriota bacterium]
MHERALIQSLTHKVEQLAAADGADRVTRVEVRLGALSHFTPEHFREHFDEAARGTLADGAEVVATLDPDITASYAGDVVLESIEVELADAARAS